MTIQKITFYPILIFLAFSCREDKTNELYQTPTASSEQVSEKKLFLTIDAEQMDCDGSTIEQSSCTAYIADSLSLFLEELYDSLVTDSNLEIAGSKEYLATLSDDDNDGDIDYLKSIINDIENIRNDLITSQKYLYKY